jgi:hypothetical protein
MKSVCCPRRKTGVYPKSEIDEMALEKKHFSARSGLNHLSGLYRLTVLLHPRLLCPPNTVTAYCSDQLASATGIRRSVALQALLDKHFPFRDLISFNKIIFSKQNDTREK